jgi:hypothetical protein
MTGPGVQLLSRSGVPKLDVISAPKVKTQNRLILNPSEIQISAPAESEPVFQVPMTKPKLPQSTKAPIPQSAPALRVSTKPNPYGPPSTIWRPTPTVHLMVSQMSQSTLNCSQVV